MINANSITSDSPLRLRGLMRLGTHQCQSAPYARGLK